MKQKFPLWIALVFILVFLLRLPSLFEPYSYGDEAIYLTLGEAARKGLVFYRDIHDNKPPLLYLLAAISGNLFWFRFLLLVWNLATIYLFYKLAQVLFPRKENLTKAVTFIFAILSSAPLLEGNIANAEIFMILPTILGVFLFFKTKVKKAKNYFLIGILFSLSTLFKIPAAFDFAALFLFFVFFSSKEKFHWKNLAIDCSFLILGFILPILLTFIYYFFEGGLKQYLTAAFFQNIPYLSSWQQGSGSSGLNFGVVNRGILLLFVIAILWLFRKKWGEAISFIMIWFLFALFGATLSGRPYPHYLVQILAPVSLLIITFLVAKTHLKIIILAFLGLIWGTVIYFNFWSYPNLSYYQNFLAFSLRQKSQEEYLRHFGGKVIRNYRLAQFLQTTTKPNEKIFIWGDSPVIYALARRLPVGRYTAAYHIIDFNGYGEVMDALNKNKPRIIIDLGEKDHPFPQLEAFLAENYFLIISIEEAKVYHLGTWK